MFLPSGTFFLLSSLPAPAQVAAQALPLTHVVGLARGLISGTISSNLICGVVWVTLATPILFIVGISLMRKRLIK